MAEVLIDYEFPSGGPRSKYPWDKWLDGQVWRIDPDDYDATTENFRSQVHAAARAKGLKVRTHIVGGSVIIEAKQP